VCRFHNESNTLWLVADWGLQFAACVNDPLTKARMLVLCAGFLLTTTRA
jgi:hypothetical protein